MAQVSPDAFGSGDMPATVDEIATLIAQRTPVVAGVEAIALGDADGRVLAEDLVAPLDLPGFDNSAVDGYAVAHADLDAKAETILRVGSRIPAGHAARPHTQAGTATRIFTGAAMPSGADTVFMQEDVRVLEDEKIGVPAGLEKSANVRAGAKT